MANDSALALLKANLGYFDSQIPQALEAYLENELAYAKAQLYRAGVELFPQNLEDNMLLAMYAAWHYRKAAEGTAKPPMVQAAIRDRQVSKALRDAELEETYVV